METIVQVAGIINKTYYKLQCMLDTTGRKKELPSIWFDFSYNIILQFRRKLFRYFYTLVDNDYKQVDPHTYISEAVEQDLNTIKNVCKEVTRKKMDNCDK